MSVEALCKIIEALPDADPPHFDGDEAAGGTELFIAFDVGRYGTDSFEVADLKALAEERNELLAAARDGVVGVTWGAKFLTRLQTIVTDIDSRAQDSTGTGTAHVEPMTETAESDGEVK